MCKRAILIAACLTLSVPLGLSAQLWNPDVRLTNEPHFSSTSQNNNGWCVAASANGVHVVWYDTRDGSEEIYYKHSTDKGVSWSEDTRLSSTPGTSENPSVAVMGGVIVVVWEDYRDGNSEIYFKQSTNNGDSWGADTRLTNNGSGSHHPSVAISQTNTGWSIHVVWDDLRDGNFEIYYKRSTDGGISWGADTRLTNDAGNSYWPSVAASDTIVHVAWTDDRPGTDQVYYKRSTNNGTSWQGDKRITVNSNMSGIPSIAAEGYDVHLAFLDNRTGHWEIYYTHSGNNGSIWDGDTRLSDDPDDSHNPSIAATYSAVFVVWDDHRDGNYEIYYRLEDVFGHAWGPETRVTNSDGDSQNPSIAFYDDRMHVVWSDYRDGNWEIYYTHDTLDRLADNLIKNADEDTSGYVGDSIYNDDGEGQTKTQAIQLGDTAIYHIKFENEGELTQGFVITGDGDTNGWNVEYYDSLIEGNNITSSVTYTGWGTNLSPGEYYEIRMEVTPDEPDTTVCEVLVSCYPDFSYFEDVVKATTLLPGPYRPDNQIRNSSDAEYAGDDIYNNDGENQSKSQHLDTGDTATYHIKLENDGSLPDQLTITGTGSGGGWAIRYYDALTAGSEITLAVLDSGWTTEELDADSFVEIRVEVVPPTWATEDTLYEVLVTSTSVNSDTLQDVVKATTTVESIGVEEDKAPVPLAYSLNVSSLSAGKASVSYTLPEGCKVKLSIYDVTGRALKTLASGKIEAGYHTVELNDGFLSKGVYFVRLEAEGNVFTRKLVLTR